MKRSIRKKELKAARKARQRDPKLKSGFRKLVIGDRVYQWRYPRRSTHVEIRCPGGLGIKWIVPVWQLQEYASQEAWLTFHKNCTGEYCYGYDVEPCCMYMVTPGMIRKYIDEMEERVTCG
jgi:hypothetical protein